MPKKIKTSNKTQKSKTTKKSKSKSKSKSKKHNNSKQKGGFKKENSYNSDNRQIKLVPEGQSLKKIFKEAGVGQPPITDCTIL